ncbi:PAAR domain-containing protein [Pseudomonas sp. QL9]|uniref:PAAR domain-containing protein n=1 Tax=Pseudomonas sp. QL9 TaxID=3242725 RepID=UPI00352A0EC6
MMRRPNVHGKGQALHGDETTTGALLISSIAYFATCDGRGMVRLGDITTTCPKCAKPGVVAEGDHRVTWEGSPIAVDGNIVACGCPLGTNRIIAPLGSLSSTKSTPPDVSPAAASLTDSALLQPQRRYASSFSITDSESGKPLAYREFVALVDGSRQVGVTDSRGLAHIDAASKNAEISIHVKFKAPARTLDEMMETSK